MQERGNNAREKRGQERDRESRKGKGGKERRERKEGRVRVKDWERTEVTERDRKLMGQNWGNVLGNGGYV